MTSTPVKLAFSCTEPAGVASNQPPIILCHALACSKEHWAGFGIPQILADATKRKVYAIDARNQGDSEWSDVLTSDANVDDLLHFMDSVEAKTATIVGHSMGGTTAMRAALRAPERIERIVVEDMPCSKIPQQVFDMIEDFSVKGPAFLENLPAETDEQEAKKMLYQLMVKDWSAALKGVMNENASDTHIIQLKRLEDGRLAFKSNAKVIGKAAKDPGTLIAPYKGVYNGPACFIYGTISPFNVGGDEKNIRTHFPNAELIPIENATHDVHADCTDDFVKSLLKFLTR